VHTDPAMCLAVAALRDAQVTAERAIDLEDDGQQRAAYDEWKKLLDDMHRLAGRAGRGADAWPTARRRRRNLLSSVT
jgi:hypothetical protein